MEIHNEPRLLIPRKQSRPQTPRKVLTLQNIILHTTHKLFLMLQIHIQRKHVPAKQFLAITSIEPKRGNLALYNHDPPSA